jgi:hypothetical protein
LHAIANLRESHTVWKNSIGKTGVPVFLSVTFSFDVIEKE